MSTVVADISPAFLLIAETAPSAITLSALIAWTGAVAGQ